MTERPALAIRPRQRTLVRLPYAPAGENYALLEDICDLTRRGAVKYDRNARAFSVARKHTRRLLDALVGQFGDVDVVQHGTSEGICVEACWQANPDTWADCECMCAGANHGSGAPFGPIVGQASGGPVSVAITPGRSFTLTREDDR